MLDFGELVKIVLGAGPVFGRADLVLLDDVALEVVGGGVRVGIALPLIAGAWCDFEPIAVYNVSCDEFFSVPPPLPGSWASSGKSSKSPVFFAVSQSHVPVGHRRQSHLADRAMRLPPLTQGARHATRSPTALSQGARQTRGGSPTNPATGIPMGRSNFAQSALAFLKHSVIAVPRIDDIRHG